MHNGQYGDSQREEGTGPEQRWAKGARNVDICNSDNYKNKVTRNGLFSLNTMKITE